MQKYANARTQAECEAACCVMGLPDCGTAQWCPAGSACSVETPWHGTSIQGCWLGHACTKFQKKGAGWVSTFRNVPSPPPSSGPPSPSPPPPGGSTTSSFTLANADQAVLVGCQIEGVNPTYLRSGSTAQQTSASLVLKLTPGSTITGVDFAYTYVTGYKGTVRAVHH